MLNGVTLPVVAVMLRAGRGARSDRRAGRVVASPGSLVSVAVDHEHDQTPTVGTPPDGAAATAAGSPLDLDAIERDLADVETALGRLEAGTYWTDEDTGEPLSERLLESHPTARRA